MTSTSGPMMLQEAQIKTITGPHPIFAAGLLASPKAAHSMLKTSGPVSALRRRDDDDATVVGQALPELMAHTLDPGLSSRSGDHCAISWAINSAKGVIWPLTLAASRACMYSSRLLTRITVQG